jgi:ankyrin repeat protein
MNYLNSFLSIEGFRSPSRNDDGRDGGATPGTADQPPNRAHNLSCFDNTTFSALLISILLIAVIFPICATAAESPLFLAVQMNNSQQVVQIVRADPSSVNSRDIVGQTPLFYAVLSNKIEMVDFLLKHGADSNAKNKMNQTVLYTRMSPDIALRLIEANIDVNSKDITGSTALHWAAFTNDAEVAKILLSHGAEIEAKDSTQQTPLMVAATRGSLSVMRVLIAANANTEARNSFGETVVFLAAARTEPSDRAATLDLLKEARADISAKDISNNTALHGASEKGNADAVTWLVKNGSEVNARNDREQTPLMKVEDAKKKLLSSGEPVDANRVKALDEVILILKRSGGKD